MLSKSHFEIEKKRQRLATKGKINELKKLYSPSLPEIKNLNTGKFWDERIDENMNINLMTE